MHLPPDNSESLVDSRELEQRGQTPSMTSVKDLPPEMVATILGYLPFATKKTCRLVCESWLAILDYHFHAFNVELDDSTVKHVLNCRNSFETLTVGSLDKSKLAISGTRNRICLAATKFVGIRSIVSKSNLVKILTATGDSVEYLAFANYTLRSLGSSSHVWKFMKFQALQQLSITMTEFDAQHHQAALGLFRHGNFQMMVKFHVEFSWTFDIEPALRGGYSAAPFYRICPVLIEFLLRHAPTLKELAMILPNKLVGNFNPTAECEAKLFQLCDSFRSIKLSRIGLNIPGHRIVKNLCRNLLESQTSLKNLVMLGHPLSDSDTTFIERNKDAVEVLFWGSTTTDSNHGNQSHVFDCEILSKCPKLWKLELITSKPVRNLKSLPIHLTKICWSADLSYSDLKWMTTHLVNLAYLSLVVENYIELETWAKIVPITCPVFVNDILPMPRLVKFNLQCHCELRRIQTYCEMCEGLEAVPKNGITIYIDRKTLKRAPLTRAMDEELLIIGLIGPFFVD